MVGRGGVAAPRGVGVVGEGDEEEAEADLDADEPAGVARVAQGKGLAPRISEIALRRCALRSSSETAR